MVYCRRYGLEASATYWCACGEGELQITYGKNKNGFHPLSENQMSDLFEFHGLCIYKL